LIDENVSNKVIKIIQSYTGVVNKMVWRKTDNQQLTTDNQHFDEMNSKK